MTDKSILIVDRGLAFLEDRLAGYEVHRLWDHADPIAFAARAPFIRVIVTLGSARLDPALVEALAGLGLIACLASGYEGIDVAHARARGVEVTHSASVNADDVADYAVAMILALTRGVVVGDAWVRAGRWGGERLAAPRAVGQLNMGIVGLGTIGAAIARRLEVFGPRIAWWGRRDRPDLPWSRIGSLAELASWSDVLVVAARADASNRKMIDAPILAALGSEGLLVNVSRGSILDEDALIDALRAGRLGGAALDVFEEEPTPPARWANVPNTILSPHMAGTTTRTGSMMTGLLLENIRCFFEGQPLKTPVPLGFEPR